ncbi:MAG: hypothetical protein ACJ79O_16905, partial [Myxococcales bacterium]
MNRIIFVPIAVLAVSCGQNALTGAALDIHGQPLAGAQVRMGSLPPVTTDAGGRFSVDGAPATYDAAVVTQIPATEFVPAKSVAVVYVGLTRRDPTLWLPVEQLPASFFGTASYSVSRGPGSRCALYVLVDNHGNRYSQMNALDRTCAGGPLFVMPWFGSTSSSGSLVALTLGGPQAIAASGHIAVRANDGGGPRVIVPVSPAEPLSIEANTTVPASCFLVDGGIIVPGKRSEPGAVVLHGIAAGAFPFNVGWTAEAPLALVARAQCNDPSLSVSAALRRIRRDTTSYPLDLPPPPVLTVPTTVTATAPFTWTAPAASLSLLRFSRVGQDGSITSLVFVVTAARSASFPDLGGL